MIGFLLWLALVWYGGTLLVVATCPCARLSYLKKDTELPSEMLESIKRIERVSKSKSDFVRKSYAFLSNRFKGYWFPFFLNPPSLYWKNLDYIWNYRGVLVCLNLNYVASQFLTNSKFFKKSDVSLNWAFLRGFSFHQYLVVDVDGKKVPFDVWRGKINF